MCGAFIILKSFSCTDSKDWHQIWWVVLFVYLFFFFFFPLLLSKYLKKDTVTCLMVTKLLALVLAGEWREGWKDFWSQGSVCFYPLWLPIAVLRQVCRASCARVALWGAAGGCGLCDCHRRHLYDKIIVICQFKTDSFIIWISKLLQNLCVPSLPKIRSTACS